MLKTRILLIGSAAVLVGLLFLLPKAVVENQAEIAPNEQQNSVPESHQAISTSDQNRIKRLRAAVGESALVENNAIFADSLANLYVSAGRFDSAALYKEKLASFFGTPDRQVQAGDAWYQAFTFSLDPEKRSEYALKAQDFFKAALEKEPSNADIKVKLALTYMGTSTPMQGIGLLREVLATQPKHEKALQNMGMLSLQSGQFAKAVEWLTRLTEAYPENIEGQLLLGAAFAGTGDKEKARAQYERTRTMTNDPAVQQQLDQYIKDLK
ncbi:MAG: tetratricopeptide repeat protein [Cyclobacteriaceae bacterium]